MQQLFLSSYNGTIYTLGFYQERTPHQALEVIASTTNCRPHPSWITVDRERRLLYGTANHRDAGNGELKAFSIQPDGSLKFTGTITTPIGAAYHILDSTGNTLAVAFYHGARVCLYDVHDPMNIKTKQEISFPPFPPGPGKVQNQPRPHQVVIDPTGDYMLVPDLGADCIRVLKITKGERNVNALQECGGVDLPKGSFPRHIVFVVLRDRTILYLLNQDICTLITYRVDYLPDNLGLELHKQGVDIDLFQRPERIVEHPADARILASHLTISPDHKFLMASVRDDNAFKIQNPTNPGQTINSDSILSYRIDQNTGALSLASESPAGGGTPRQFSLNRTGDRLAVVQQKNGWVSIFNRNPETAEIGDLLAFKEGFGEMGPVCILWDSEREQ